jgi:hypothetical protein
LTYVAFTGCSPKPFALPEARFTTTTLTPGRHKITATYLGSADFTGGSASLTQTVNERSADDQRVCQR